VPRTPQARTLSSEVLLGALYLGGESRGPFAAMGKQIGEMALSSRSRRDFGFGRGEAFLGAADLRPQRGGFFARTTDLVAQSADVRRAGGRDREQS
jgi:hypothetical protein